MQFLTSQRSISLLASFLMLAAVFSVSTVQPAKSAETPEIPGELTGNIGVNSQYVFRGVLESGEPVVNGGLDYSIGGFYAGYWASELGSDTDGASYAPGALENDFYLGFAGEAGPVSYDIGALQYYYSNTDGSDANEVYGSLGVGPASLGVTYTTKSVSWTNEGDIYATLSASETLFGDLTGSALVRYSSLDSDGPAWGSNVDDGLSQIELGISHPIGETGADFSLDYIINDSENAPGSSDNQVVLGLTYGFGIAK